MFLEGEFVEAQCSRLEDGPGSVHRQRGESIRVRHRARFAGFRPASRFINHFSLKQAGKSPKPVTLSVRWWGPGGLAYDPRCVAPSHASGCLRAKLVTR